eukprot:jgi/Ulvmu1/8045/UM004_0282.1
MLAISVVFHRPCERLRACCHEIGPGSRGSRAQLRTSTVYTRCAGDDAPLRATRKTLEDGTVQFLFTDEVETEAITADVAEDDTSEAELSETDKGAATEDDGEVTDDGTETDNDALEDGQRQDELNSLTVKQLKQLCKEHGIKGYSALRKRQIVKLIREEVHTLDI